MTKDCLRLLVDARLSTDARTVALYVASMGPGEHEVPAGALRRLLNQAGEKRVRQAVQDAADLKWISRREGGRGHSPVLEFTPAQAADLSDSSAASADLSADSSAQAADLKAPSSSPTSSSSPSTPRAEVRERASGEHVSRLAGLLGEHSEVLQRFEVSADHGPTWAAAVWGAFHAPVPGTPDGGGTEWTMLAALSDDGTRRAALARALSDYADKGQPFRAMLFRGYVEKAVKETRRRTIRMAAAETEEDHAGTNGNGASDGQHGERRNGSAGRAPAAGQDAGRRAFRSE